MKAKEYLKRYKSLGGMIVNKFYEKELLQGMAEGITLSSAGERVQTSKVKQSMADSICKYLDLDAEIQELLKEQAEILATLSGLEFEEYDILHRIYIQDSSLKAIARAKKRSYSWATQTHSRALANLQEILDEREATWQEEKQR